MKKILLLSLILMIALAFFGCDLTGAGDAELVNVWKMTSATYTDSTGTEIANFPIDMFTDDYYGVDPDGDGYNETAMLDVYYEITDSIMRIYEKYDITDGGSNTAYLPANDMVDIFEYYPSLDTIYTTNGNVLTTTSNSYTEIFTFEISGTTLTLTEENDMGTPSDTSDDTIEVFVFTLASRSDIADAVNGDL